MLLSANSVNAFILAYQWRVCVKIQTELFFFGAHVYMMRSEYVIYQEVVHLSDQVSYLQVIQLVYLDLGHDWDMISLFYIWDTSYVLQVIIQADKK